MPKINIPYTTEYYVDPVTKKGKDITKPYIKIRMKVGHKIDKFPTVCLLDSGADNNLFPAQWGEVMGIKLKTGIKREHVGIGGAKLIAYAHNVSFYVGTQLIRVEVDFAEEQTLPLLGRTGFFKHFKKITFDEVKKQLVLEHD